FDQGTRPSVVASFQKPVETSLRGGSLEARERLLGYLRATAWFGTVLTTLGIVLMIGSLLGRALGSSQKFLSYCILAGVVTAISGFVIMATAILRAETIPWQSLWSNEALASIQAEQIDPPTAKDQPQTPAQIAWETVLGATGTESRIGDALQSVLEQEQSSTLAAVLLLTDGRSNAGVDPQNVVSLAARQEVRIHPVGLGTDKNPTNVKILDMEAPKRVFPGDRFRIAGLVQASGMLGTQVPVQLRRRPGGGSNVGPTIEEERTLTLEGDDAITSLSFEVTPREVGPWIYELKVLAPTSDSNAADNQFESEVRVVEPNSTILILAGGPTREYQFVRNLLFREPTVQSHVFLQSSGPGVSQEAKQLLTEFPKTLAEMTKYDAVIAFDADWTKLTSEQIEVLETWVSQQAGGLIVVAGPVSTPKWAGNNGNGNRNAEILRGMVPVIMNTRGARLVSIGRFESETAWPLTVASNALATDFLQVGTSIDDSRKAWERFRGVFSFYGCYEPKPAASVLLTFSDPTTFINSAPPIYLASQFYGSGRVVFQGGGEFWRMREVGEQYFDTYYTKLVRWAGQGRLLRDSDRGMLLVDKEQAIVGEQVMVRAVLKDAQFQPLIQNEAIAKLLEPGGRSTQLRLAPLADPTQAGVYVGQYTTRKTGTYEVQLPIGSLAEQVLLTQQTIVRVPALEIQRPQRNDPLLSELASKTGGTYSLGLSGLDTIVSSIKPREQVNYLPNAPDNEFRQRLNALLMALIAGALSLEWLTRRLSRLA
ncbi:MAG: VWA domain-containing protein, partial [Planctomycetota bacterium]